jgi:uroporphyrinogen-III synthase
MKIAITRLKEKGASDAPRCRAFGHECYPVSPLRSDMNEKRVSAFVTAVHRNDFDCIFFTSALPAQIIAPHLISYPRVIAIGPKTAEALQEYGIDCETLPAFYSRDFVPYLGDWIKKRHIGIPRADVPNPDLLEAIRAAGGFAHEFRCYSLIPTGETLDLGEADAILFTSAMSFKTAVWEPRPDLLVIAIGEITAETMEEGGIHPAVVGDGSLEGTLTNLNVYLSRISESPGA